MHLKMDSWQSEWVYEDNLNRELSTPIDSTPLNSSLYSVDWAADSTNFSRDDSIESGGEEILVKNDTSVLKPTFKSVLQAKKRLQAFSAAKQLKTTGSKEEKTEDDDKNDKLSPKKLKKAVYPGDKAKAVIQEIEEIKKHEAIEAKVEQDRYDTLMHIAFKSIMRPRSRSLSPEGEKYFKRREIKSRNYRRSDSYNRKSVSPEDYGRRNERSPPRRPVYPKNWTQYKKLNLTVVKDEELKSKTFSKQKYSHHELVTRLINFTTPSPLLETFKYFSLEDKTENVPVSFMRVTRSKPPLTFSVNSNKIKESFITRNQLFQIISRDRRNAIETLINTPSRCQPNGKIFQSRQWYSKSWKKTSDAECRVLENSVGLSFLQTYSDEEEEIETEEIVICSSTKDTSAKKAVCPDIVIGSSRKDTDVKKPACPDIVTGSSRKDLDVKKTVCPDIVTGNSRKDTDVKTTVSPDIVTDSSRKDIDVKKTVCSEIAIGSSTKENDVQIELPKETIPLKEIVEIRKPQTERDISIHTNVVLEEMLEKQVKEREEKENLRQGKSEGIKRYQQDELNETRKAIRELEEELERRKAIHTEEEAKERRKVKKKRKKVKKKRETLVTAEEDEEEAPKRKKKKKRSKKKKNLDDDDDDSLEDEKRRKKKSRKTGKYKKEKSKKKRERSKKEEMPVKEHKTKKKEEDIEESSLKEENKRKKRKSSIADQNDVDEKSKLHTLEQPKMKSKKKSKKKKGKNDGRDTEKESDKNAETFINEDKKKLNKENEEFMKEPNEHSGKKRRRKDKYWSVESETVTEAPFQFYEFEKSDRSILDKSKKNEESDHIFESKQGTKIDMNRSSSREKSSKFEKESKRHGDEHVSKSKDRESFVSDRESRKSKDNSEKFHKLEESLKKKKESEDAKTKEVKSSERIEDNSSKRYQKEDSERHRKYSEKSERIEKRDATDRKSNRDKKNSEVFEKSEYQTEKDNSKDRIKDKHQREKRYKEDHPQTLERMTTKQEPDWEKLRSKRKRHRNSDSKEPSKDLLDNLDLPEDLEAFPLEKEIFISKEKDRKEIPNKRSRHEYRRETGTPDTDEYRENWEKDIFPIWESEDEAPPKPKEKLNNSWESDEEVFERSDRIIERGNCIIESARPFNSTFDLEIPLNIKPFKRREVIDTDTELQLLKRESQTLSEERRRLEIEKLRVKELELKVIREVENKVKEQYKPKGVRIVENKVKEDYKPKVMREVESKSKEEQYKQKNSREVPREEHYKSKTSREVESKVKEDQNKQKIAREVDSKLRENQCKPKIAKEVESRAKLDHQNKQKIPKHIESKAKEDQNKLKLAKDVESKDKTDPLKPTVREVVSILKENKPVVVQKKVQEDQPKSQNQIGSKGEKESKNLEQEKVEVKRGRWDKKVAQPRMSTPKVDIADNKVRSILDEDDSLTNVSSTTSLNNSSAVLENEYEEFMKAVSSSTTQKKSRRSREEISSFDSSSFDSSDSESSSSKVSQSKKQPRNDTDLGREKFVFKNIITNLDELNPAPLDSPSRQNNVTILPQDIPLIPMPLSVSQAEIKPVPVPSPSIDIDNIRKPLFNLGLSNNITLDVTSKLSGIESPNGKSMEFVNPILAASSSPNIQKIEGTSSSRKAECIVNFASPLTDVSLDSMLFEDKPSEKEDTRLNDKPFVFTSMVLPSKRSLLNNSNLNFGDSEDEEVNASKSMRKLEEIIKENMTDSAKVSDNKEKEEVLYEKAKEMNSSKGPINMLSHEKDKRRSRSPASSRIDSRRRSNERVMRRDISPKRMSSARREPSPRRRIRESSPKHRGPSPRRNASPRKRSPPRRRNSPVKRKYSPRRSISPRPRRRSSISPPRKLSPRRSISPRSFPKRPRSPERLKSILPPYKSMERSIMDSNRRRSPITITSPLEGLKRSVADSTISDDLLPQPHLNMEEYTESPISRFYDRTAKPLDSPKRVPLDIRISQVLGLTKDEPKPISNTYSAYNYEQTQYRQQFSQPPQQKSNIATVQKVKVAVKQTKGSFVQVGNMVRIVPTEDIPVVQPTKTPVRPLPKAPPIEKKPVVVHKREKKSQIVQVGNMLQIVPADMLPDVPLPPEPKTPKLKKPIPKQLTPKQPEPKQLTPKQPEPKQLTPKQLTPKQPEPKLVEPKLVELKVEAKESIPETSVVVQEKQSAETAMRLKVAECREERDKRRQERERRRKEKEKRRKEKEKQRQIKLKQRTENMIKKALQLEVDGGEEEEESVLNETPTQWPPLPIIISSVSKEVGKSILIREGQSKSNTSRSDKTKIVQFADGVRPGEGTSPSGGEELSSPPPLSKKLPKEKRYKKTKIVTKTPKKKVKVKVIKKSAEKEESDEEDNLPPPSPPPGSPPPHLFPPRLKTQNINNIHAYIPNVVPIQASHNQQLYRPQLNLIMQPPHPPHHVPPPPAHHHGLPLQHHAPPPSPHHGPPLPHHAPPPSPHHGPPLPHHAPPPSPHHGPPPQHHAPPPSPHHGPPLPHHVPPPSPHHGPPPQHHAPPPSPHHGPPPLPHHVPPPSSHHGPSHHVPMPPHHHHGPPPLPGTPLFRHGPPPPVPSHHHGTPGPHGPPGHHHHGLPPPPYHH